MNKKITKIALMLLMITKLMLIQTPALAQETQQQVIPVRFLYGVSSAGIEEGNAVALEITEDIYINGKKLFKQGGAGYATIAELKKASSFGRGGKIFIQEGSLTDINGQKHKIYLSSNTKGDFKISSAAGTLIGASSAFEIGEIALGSGITATMFGLGVILIPIAFMLKKGNEAKLEQGTIMFAHLA